MRVSQLIEVLQQLQSTRGDLPVFTDAGGVIRDVHGAQFEQLAADDPIPQSIVIS